MRGRKKNIVQSEVVADQYNVEIDPRAKRLVTVVMQAVYADGHCETVSMHHEEGLYIKVSKANEVDIADQEG